MNWQAIRKGNRTLVVVGMVVAMVLSAASVATAEGQSSKRSGGSKDGQPVATENIIDLQPTEAAGGATAQFTYSVETREDGTQALTGWECTIMNLETDDNDDLFLVDDEGDAVHLGTMPPAGGALEGGAEMPVENFQNFEGVDVSRWSDENNDWVVMFEAELPK